MIHTEAPALAYPSLAISRHKCFLSRNNRFHNRICKSRDDSLADLTPVQVKTWITGPTRISRSTQLLYYAEFRSVEAVYCFQTPNTLYITFIITWFWELTNSLLSIINTVSDFYKEEIHLYTRKIREHIQYFQKMLLYLLCIQELRLVHWKCKLIGHTERVTCYMLSLEEFLFMFSFTDSKASLTHFSRNLAK